MHKTGDKKLLIRFSQKQEQLVCSITDNGIGREKAAAIKKQKIGSQYFESKGTDLVRQRIQLLKENGAINAQLFIEDVTDQFSNITGTNVIIDIPILHL